jgi:hypothetical protein
MNPANFPDNKRRKQKEALDRNNEWKLMAPGAQLKALDRRPGACKKQREKILERLKPAVK